MAIYFRRIPTDAKRRCFVVIKKEIKIFQAVDAYKYFI